MAEILKHIDFVESWYRVWCPYCETGNWFCNGNESDLSGIDVDAIKCRSCAKVFLLAPPDPIMDDIRGDDYELNTEDGIEFVKR